MSAHIYQGAILGAKTFNFLLDMVHPPLSIPVPPRRGPRPVYILNTGGNVVSVQMIMNAGKLRHQLLQVNLSII